MYTHFLDFEKAFDYVHIESLRNIMRRNGIPDKTARVIGGIYMGLARQSLTGV